jgi:DNA-binding CsgD family transcriptional regulator/PAS domain-containing protein
MARDARSFDAAVGAIYATALEPSQWPVALQAIAECFGDVGAVMLYQRDDGTLGTIISTNLSAAAQAEYEREWWRHDIRSFRGLERGFIGGRDAFTDRDVVTPEEVATHPIYTQFLVPNGFGWFAAVTICPDPSRLVWISVQRAMRKPAFTDDDLSLLTRLGRHAEAALRLGIRLLDAEVAKLTLAEALARLGVAVFLLDGAARIAFTNPAGQRLLGDGLVASQKRLRARFEPEHSALRDAISAALAGDRVLSHEGPSRPVLVRGLNDEHLLAVYVLPVTLPTGHAVERLIASARVCVVAMSSKAGEPVDPSLVRDILGLTLGEARVASLIGAGMPPRTAAERLGIGEETARKTLKKVFAKVGVSRQGELSLLLSKLVLH